MATKRKLGYVTSRNLSKVKEEIIVEQVDATLVRVQYRDLKNHVRKFSPRRKLKVELIIEIHSANVTKKIMSKSYSLPYAYRKRPVDKKVFLRQIKKKHIQKLEKGHLILENLDPQQNFYKWSYFYTSKQHLERHHRRRERKLAKKKKIQKIKKSHLRSIEKKLKRGSKRGHKKSK